MQFSADTCVDEWQTKAHGGAFRPIIRSIMELILQSWQLLLVILAGWMNRQQQEVIEYLRTENHVLNTAQANDLHTIPVL
jgi:hypothetical protein